MRSLARWGSLPLLAAPLGSWALGLGEIELNSYLNQPMDAEIPLSATPEELAGLSVTLAPAAAYTAAGFEYPAVLSSLDLDIGRNAAGENVIVVSSARSITEPFLTMVIQVSYPRGSFTRDYTVLLDPPLFLPANAAAEPIAAPVTRDSAPAPAGGAIVRQPAAPAPAPQPAPAAPAPAPRPVAANGDYTVQSGDTLWGIAERNRAAGVSTNQAMISIYEANSAAFDGNINRLRRGAILRIPPAATQGAIGVAAANAEVQRQIDEWRSGVRAEPRLTLLVPSDEAAVSGAAVGAAGGNPAAVTALENEVADLQAQLAAARAEADEAQRLLQLQSAELADLQNQAGQDPQPVTPVDDQIFVDEEVAPAPPVEEPVAVVEPEPAAQPPVAVIDTRDSGPSLVDRILGFVTNPLYLAIGGAAIVLFGLLAFLRRRNDEVEDVTGQWEALEAEIDEEADHAATARIRAQRQEPAMMVVEGDQGDATAEEPKLGGTAEIEALHAGTGTVEFEAFSDGTAEIESLTQPEDDSPSGITPDPQSASQTNLTLSSQTVINLDQADPIAEADFHMAYGLYDQAADLISKALTVDPGNLPLRLKLLEVFFVWGNKESFLESAQALRGDIGPANKADWDKVVIMGKQICPDEALFSEATAAAGEIDLDLEAGGTSAGLDFAFDDADDDEVDLDFGTVPDDDIALEASGRHATSEDDMLAIGERTQAGLEAAMFEDIDDQGEQTSPGEIGDLDATMESPTVETSMRGSGDDFDGLTLESPTVEVEHPEAPTVESPTIEAQGPESVDSGDTVEQPGLTSTAATSEMTAEIALDDLGLDVGDLENLPGADDDDLLSATGVTQVLHDQDDIEFTGTAILDDDDATLMAPGFGSDPTGIQTAVLEQPVSNFEPEAPESEDDLDLNLDDFSSALEGGGETVEQPMASRFSGLDLDVGDDIQGDDEPTGTEEVGPLDPQTMTEVGTKLDLARAYIDMGDPEGAKSILEEVLSEGDAGQRSEAKALIDALPA